MITELLGKSKEELRAFCVALGEPAFRGAQIYHALYAERKFDVAQITNLPKELRERLSKEARVALPKVKQRFASADGSVRYLFGLDNEEKHKRFNAEGTESAEFAEKNGEERVSRLQKSASVEAVFMPSEGRQTICISTQAGCAVDCHFCLTAQLGLIRNLTAGEILAQVLLPLEEAHRGTRIEKKDGGLKPAATKSGLAPHHARPGRDGDFAEARDAFDKRDRAGHRTACAGEGAAEARDFVECVERRTARCPDAR